jgi:hypothetical protein
MGFKRWRKKADGRSLWSIIVKEALVKLRRPYVSEEDEEEFFPFFTFLIKKTLCFYSMAEPLAWVFKLRNV